MLRPLLPKPQAPLLPPLRRALPPIIPPLTIIQYPRLRKDPLISAIIIVPVIILRIPLEQRKDILHTKLADRLAALNRRLREFALRLLQSDDAFFDGVVDGETVHGDVDGLVEAVDTVDGLFFYELCGC